MAGRETGKSPGSRPVLAAALALGVVLCLLLHESLFLGKVLTQADALSQFEPWASVAPPEYAPSNELLLDQSIGWLPWMDFQAEQLRRCELPLWNPYNYCGEPLVGTYQSALYWPLAWVYHLWPSWHAHAWIACAKLWLAGLFMVLFLRRLGLSGGAAAVGGQGYMLCGFMVVWLNHPHSSAALFLPALCWSVERVAARPAAREAALFGLLVGLSFVAGHVQTSVHLALFLGVYVLFRALVPVGSIRLAPRGMAVLALGAVLGVVLAAPQLLPFLEYVDHSQAVGVFGRMDTVAHRGVTEAAVLMVDPDFYGAPHTHDYRGPVGPNLNYNELSGGYVGRVLLALALLQTLRVFRLPARRLLTLFYLGVVCTAGLVAFQVEPVYSFFDAIPLLRSTKLMRALLFVAFGLCVLATLGLEAVLCGRRWKSWLLPVSFCLVAAEQLAFARGYNPQVDPGLLLPRTEVTDFLRREQGDHRSLGTDNSILKPNANVFYRVSMVSGYDSMEDKAMAELVLRMTRTPPEFPFISQIGAFDRAEAFPLASLLGVKFFLSTTELPPPLRKVLDAELMVFENPQVMPRAFLAREVRVVQDATERLELLASAGFDPWVAILEEEPEAAQPASPQDPAPRRAGAQGGTPAGPDEPTSGDQVLVKSMRPREVLVHVRTGRRGLLVLTDAWDPGWTAEVRTLGTADEEDARGRQVPIERVDHALRGVWLEPGTWALRFRYDPLSTRLGLALGLGAALALLALALRPWPRHGRSACPVAGAEPA